jgi:predicted N-acyltransferase
MGFFGSVFDTSSDSPYEEIFPDCKIKNSATVEELDEKFWNMCKKENYNELIEWQYENLNKSGLILESTDSMNRLLSVIDRNTSLLETI